MIFGDTYEVPCDLWEGAMSKRANGFRKPENYEKIEDLEDGRHVFAGGMDWEPGWTWAGIHAKDTGTKWEDQPDEWLEIDHSDCVCKGDAAEMHYSDANHAACRAFGKKAVKDWLKKLSEKSAAVVAPPLTGPDAIHYALQHLNLDKLEASAKEAVKSGKVTKRPGAVHALNAIEGLRRNEVQPHELMIQRVPVLPPMFRPFATLGDTFVPGDANELYKDMFDMRDTYNEARTMFGEEGSSAERLGLYNAVKALYGYGDPVKPKTRQRNVSGFMRQITGTNPKLGVVQRKLLSKPQDSVSRGVISIGADLGMDEIGVPEEMAWTMYAPYIQGRLARMGVSPEQALKHLKDRHPLARRALELEVPNRPIVYSRAPSWHRHSVVSGIAKLIPGDTIAINPFVTTGLNADFDGDTINLHVPATREAIDEAHKILMPSKMLFSVRSQDKVVPMIKHEQLLGLYTANVRPSKKTHSFASRKAALQAVESGSVPMSDEVDFPDETPAAA